MLGLLLTIKSGRKTPMAEIPTPDFAVPYAAPKQVKTMADVQPITPKNGYMRRISGMFVVKRLQLRPPDGPDMVGENGTLGVIEIIWRVLTA